MSAPTGLLQSFHISPEIGFLLEEPLESLPPAFEPWTRAATGMMDLLGSGRVRDALDSLPLLDVELLRGHRELRSGHLQLSTLIAAYIWCGGDEEVPPKLPRNLAVPFWSLCQRLGILPGIASHTSLALANYKKRRAEAPLELDNMEMLHFKLIRDYGNDWFFLVTCQIEKDFAEGLNSIVKGLQATGREERAESLDGLASCLRTMRKTLTRMKEHLSPDIFFHGFRPFLAGTTSGKFAAWGGIVMEGVQAEPVQLVGGSAAQSATMQCVDAFLGIKHEPSERAFLLHTRQHLLPSHRDFVEFLEGAEFRAKVASDPGLHLPYNACLDAVEAFRNEHINLVTRFIILPKKTETHNNYKSLNEVGTGGSGIMPFLKSLRDTTKEYKFLIPPPSHEPVPIPPLLA